MPDALLATVSDLGLLVDEDLDDDDPKANLYLRIASGLVRSHCHQYLTAKVDDTVKLGTVDGMVAFLPELPVNALGAVQYIGRDASLTTIDPSQFELDPETGRLQLYRTPTWVGRIWQVTYSHGFAVLPEAITDACLGVASRTWLTPVGVENERILSRSIKYAMQATGFSGEEEAGLAEYVVEDIR